MPYNGSGTFNRSNGPTGWEDDAAASIKIRADRHDGHDQDLANGLSNAICRDGQSQVSADIPMNNHKITGLKPLVSGDSPNDAANKGYVDALREFTTSLTL